jgi:hypothetical protein
MRRIVFLCPASDVEPKLAIAAVMIKQTSGQFTDCDGLADLLKRHDLVIRTLDKSYGMHR